VKLLSDGDTQKDKIMAFQKAMIDFYRRFGRDFPWRRTADPWLVLLSELLLRKTTAKQVERVFPVISRYTPCEIAELEISALSKLLQPLGIYHDRAFLIKRVALEICKLGKVPADEKKLMKLPGVGRYTASAILCIAYGIPRAMMDRNMIRVIERVFGIISEKNRPHTDKKLWEFAHSLVPPDNCKEFNWGVLDFASKICTARNPKCNNCPLQDICKYHSLNQSINDS